jgi:hypothetical protein
MPLLLALASAALAQVVPDPTEAQRTSRFGFASTLTTTFVSGTRSPGANGRTLDGAYVVGPSYNPRFDFGLALSATYRMKASQRLVASWSLRRDLSFADTEGFRPGTGGTSSSQVVDTGDLVVSFVDSSVVRHESDLHLVLGGRVILPASRESLVCNPMYGALGLNVGGHKGFGDTARLSVTASGTRVFHRYAAAPRGRCGVPLSDHDGTDTLTGNVQPTPYDDEDFVWGATNPAWVFGTRATMMGWHGLFGLLPGVSERSIYQKLRTTASVDFRGIARRQDAEATVTTATGDLVVAAAEAPPVFFIPVSASLGFQATDHFAATLSVANQLPQLAYDRAAQLRLLPATTSVSLALTGAW